MLRFQVWLSLLFASVLAACSPRDFESVFGGYPQMHAVSSVAVDVDPLTNDLVVAAEVTVVKDASGIIYFVQESTCSVQWVFFTREEFEAPSHIGFDPHTPARIVGLASNKEAKRFFFWIDNRVPHETRNINYVVFSE